VILLLTENLEEVKEEEEDLDHTIDEEEVVVEDQEVASEEEEEEAEVDLEEATTNTVEAEVEEIEMTSKSSSFLGFFYSLHSSLLIPFPPLFFFTFSPPTECISMHLDCLQQLHLMESSFLVLWLFFESIV